MLLAQGEEGTLGGKTAEQNAALQCAAAMLEAQTLESSMRHALQVIGEYYQADRVYMMTLSEDHLEVAMIYEWMLRGKTKHPAVGSADEGEPDSGACQMYSEENSCFRGEAGRQRCRSGSVLEIYGLSDSG